MPLRWTGGFKRVNCEIPSPLFPTFLLQSCQGRTSSLTSISRKRKFDGCSRDVLGVPFDHHDPQKTPEEYFCMNVYLDIYPPRIGESLVTSSRKWKLMCSHPKHFILFVLSFISLPGLLLLFPLLNDLLDCILLKNKGSAFLAGILGRPPRTLAHAVQFRTTFNNNKNA